MIYGQDVLSDETIRALRERYQVTTAEDGLGGGVVPIGALLTTAAPV